MRLRMVFGWVVLAAGFQLHAQQPANTVDFSKQVQPILDTNCIGCHKGSSAPANLRLDSPAGVLIGSDSGKVVIPGNSKDSLLAQRISDTNGNQMPPNGPLSKDLIATIVNWIDQGAKADVAPGELTRAHAAPQGPLPTIASVTNAQQERIMLDAYCVTCHAENGPEPIVKIDKLDTANVEKNAENWEKVVRKMRAGMMPPAGKPRPPAPDSGIDDYVSGERARP